MLMERGGNNFGIRKAAANDAEPSRTTGLGPYIFDAAELMGWLACNRRRRPWSSEDSLFSFRL